MFNMKKSKTIIWIEKRGKYRYTQGIQLEQKLINDKKI